MGNDGIFILFFISFHSILNGIIRYHIIVHNLCACPSSATIKLLAIHRVDVVYISPRINVLL